MAAGRSSARGSVLRNALLLSPFLVVAGSALGFVLSDGITGGFDTSHIVGSIVVGFVTLLLADQVLQSVRDLFATTVQTTGIVKRRWNRNEFFLFRNSYIYVEKHVFRLTPAEYFDVDLGDTVCVEHYPHTATVESIEVVERARSL